MMTAKEIFENHYDELSQFEKDCYTTSDQYAFEDITFDSVRDFQIFILENFEEIEVQKMNKKKFYNHEIREKIFRQLIRYGKIIIDIQYEKYYHYFRKILIKYNNFIYEVVMENGDCVIIKNLLT